MKLSLFSTILTLLLVHSSLANKFEFEFLNRLKMSTEFKMKSRTFIKKLFSTVNEKLYSRHSEKPSKKDSSRSGHPHKSTVKKRKVNYLQYEYREYFEIAEILTALAKKYPNYIKLDTAQKLFNLPHPGGNCSHSGEKCTHYIVTLTNQKTNNKSKPQIYFSGTVHGNERVGPTATLELIKLFVENSENPWIKYLLDTRMIVITPMTNPYGYFKNVREEMLLKDENRVIFTSKNYNKYHKDINRDFPYLVNPEQCMETIGARLVNELYLNHLFLLALSLHGGTESLTYPFGVPNHIIGNKNVIPMTYFTEGKRIMSKKTPASDAMAARYRRGEFDRIMGTSTPPPDSVAFRRIAESASDHTTTHKKFHYKTGDMSGTVYPVRGGMEDWAYSGSWEGDPIINKCRPTTYKGYPIDKTNYAQNKYRDALKSIMFLLEVSHDKNPVQKYLGRKNLNCLINLRENAFFNKLKINKKYCLDPLVDGYIPRVLRLSLTLIDLLEPYVNCMVKKNKENIIVKWLVGGAITVNKTFILYDFIDDPINFKVKFEKITDNSQLRKLFKYRTKHEQGKGIWEEEFTSKDTFKDTILLKGRKGKKFIVFVVLAQVDKNWSAKNNADPPINPQTHIVNLRNNRNYTAENNGYVLKGQKYFKSKLKIIKLN